MKFYIHHKNNHRYLLLLPGWGFDYKIFLKENWDYNMIYYDEVDFSSNWEWQFVKFLSSKKIKFSVLAWSIGGFILDTLLQNNKFPTDKIENIFLLSVPAYFQTEIVEKIKQGLIVNKEKTMKHFYALVFHGRQDFYQKFILNYQDEYLKKFTEQTLMKGLNFLEHYKMNFKWFYKFNPSFFYSRSDVIVSFSAIQNLISSNVKFVPSTHIPFWYPEVVNEINKK